VQTSGAPHERRGTVTQSDPATCQEIDLAPTLPPGCDPRLDSTRGGRAGDSLGVIAWKIVKKIDDAAVNRLNPRILTQAKRNLRHSRGTLWVVKNLAGTRAIRIVSLLGVGLASCSGGGKSGAGGSAGSALSGEAGGHGGSVGIGGHAGGAGSAGTAGTVGTAGNAGSVGTTGASGSGGADAGACACFLHGTWKIDNLSPCFYSVTDDAGMSQGAISTTDIGGQSTCPIDFSMTPTAAWSTDTLTTDCTGQYRLCYTLKAGNASNPQATDCIVAQSCADGDYTTVDQPQTWPSLPGWIATGGAVTCASTFYNDGGYGEMTVTGTPTGCSTITKTIGTVTYCPVTCNQPNAPASCATCTPGASGGGF